MELYGHDLCTETYEQRVAVLWIGLAGVHSDNVDGSATTYYDTRLRAYYGEVVEGGFVIDKSKVLDKKPGLAISSPMCKGCLNPGVVDAMPDPSDSIVAHAIANDPNNPMKGLAQLAVATKGKFGGLDFIAPDLFAAWWLEKGARVGKRVGDFIEWTDGKEQIPKFEERYK